MSSRLAARTYVGLTASLFCALSCREVVKQAPAGYGPVTHAIISEFHKHALIALGENHDRKQDQDLRIDIVRSPEFQATVRNIVVECGNALYQHTLGRYIAGEPVSDEEIRHVWRDTVSSPVSAGTLPPTCESLLHEVRLINQHLPNQRKLRVLAGDPPIDWAKVRTKENFLAFLMSRDEYPARLIRREILLKKEKGLIIYGAGHIWRKVLNQPPNLSTLLDGDSPGQLFTVLRIGGVVPPSNDFEVFVRDKKPPIFLQLADTSVGKLSANQVIGRDIPIRLFPPSVEIREVADAWVYSGREPDTLLGPDLSVQTDAPYQAELTRRRLFIPGARR